MFCQWRLSAHPCPTQTLHPANKQCLILLLAVCICFANDYICLYMFVCIWVANVCLCFANLCICIAHVCVCFANVFIQMFCKLYICVENLLQMYVYICFTYVLQMYISVLQCQTEQRWRPGARSPLALETFP